MKLLKIINPEYAIRLRFLSIPDEKIVNFSPNKKNIDNSTVSKNRQCAFDAGKAGQDGSLG